MLKCASSSKLPGISALKKKKSLLDFVLWFSLLKNYELVPPFQELYPSVYTYQLPSS